MKALTTLLISLTMATFMLVGNSYASTTAAAGTSSAKGTFSMGGQSTTQYYCGSGSNKVYISIDIGCSHKGDPLEDAIFAIIRILSDGVGLVIITSLTVAGIQYTTSRGDPQATAAAVKRIRSNVTALLLFFFAYAILNYLVPGQILS